MILTGRPTHQGEACEGNDAIHEWFLWIQRIKEERIDGFGEVQTPAEDRDDPGATEFKFLNDGHIVGVITCDDVAALKNEPDHRAGASLFRQIGATGCPVEVFLEVLEHRGRQGVPDAQIWEHFRLGHLHRGAFIAFRCREDVFIRQHQQKIPQIVRRAPEPVLETEHEAAGILSLLHRQILENGGESVQELEHGVLEPGPTGLLPLLHEAGDGTLALPQLSHREAAQLVEAHHLRH